MSPTISSKLDQALPWLRLILVPGVSAAMQRLLLTLHGSAEALFAAGRPEWERHIGRGPARLLEKGPDADTLDRALRWLERPEQHLVSCADANYPRSLLQVTDYPVALYARGRPELLNAPAVAVVGSRNGTVQGCRDAHAFAQSLSLAGLCVVSGMAVGIDSAAHHGGLSAIGSSVAVLGTGVDVLYPASNAELAEALAANGCVASEFPLGTPPVARNFPCRNRLISGMSRGVLVVEAASRSGSLITARSAAEQGREVFAIPGSIHATLSKGCHELIKEGAKLVESAGDILTEIRWAAVAPASGRERAKRFDDAFLDAMGFAPASPDEIAQRTGMAASAVAVELSLREIEGDIAALPGGRFQRLVGLARGDEACRVIE